jgi:predicted alpha/beta hydrolase
VGWSPDCLIDICVGHERAPLQDQIQVHESPSPIRLLRVSVPQIFAEMPIRFPALDGYSLGGVLFCPREPPIDSTVALLSCGGGIPATRYARFARFLAASGVPALTFDYRGIGQSRPRSLRGFSAVAEDWSELDCGGAIAFLRSQFRLANLTAFAHSIGALLICGAPNIAEVSQFVFVCPHTGYHRDYLKKYRLPMAVLWHGLMPLVTRIVGYFPAATFNLGDDIPYGVAMQWAARRDPNFQPEATANDSSRARSMIARYPNVTGPAFVMGFDDDAFATRDGIRRLLSVFPNLRAEVNIVSPASVGLRKIGHFGFFRKESERLIWPGLLTRLATLRFAEAIVSSPDSQ